MQVLSWPLASCTYSYRYGDLYRSFVGTEATPLYSLNQCLMLPSCSKEDCVKLEIIYDNADRAG